jgi:hypothetical protein bfra3_17317
MTQLKTWGLLLALAISLTASARKVKVNVQQPGTLEQQLPPKVRKSLTELTLRGSLNGADWHFLRSLMGISRDTTAVDGKLQRLDLSEATLHKSTETFLFNYQIKADSILPQWAFYRCKVGEVILPRALHLIDSNAFREARIRRVVLPEKVSINEEAFADCPDLEDICFPKTLGSLSSNAIVGCEKLQTVRMNSVLFISGGGSIRDCSNLRKIEINGTLGHIDGWQTFSQLPKLTEIVFNGPVLSTGGSKEWLSQCPALQQITFNGPVLSTVFASIADLPNFHNYVSHPNQVFLSNSEWVKGIPEKGPYTEETFKAFRQLQQSFEAFPDFRCEYQAFVTSAILKNLLAVSAILHDKAGLLKYGQLILESSPRKLYSLLCDSIFNDFAGQPDFEALKEKSRLFGDYIYILKTSPQYERSEQTQQAFTYAFDSPILKKVREELKLDSIAGNGDEISRIKRVMYWLHDAIPHDGSSSWPQCKYNALDLFRHAQENKRGYNCRFLAEMLTDCYLALGYPARFITCESKEIGDPDCHVIVMVWSKTLNKWVWMDPSFAAYVTDENGILLHPGEVRERLIDGRPLVLNPDANWNHKSKRTKEEYIDRYMAKNLYTIQSHLTNRPEIENEENSYQDVITLVGKGVTYKGGGRTTSDDQYFWQAPNLP